MKTPSHPHLAVLILPMGGCELNMSCMPSFRLSEAGGWRNMTVGFHMMASIVESKNGVVWTATERIRRGGMSPWSMALRNNVSSAYTRAAQLMFYPLLHWRHTAVLYEHSTSASSEWQDWGGKSFKEGVLSAQSRFQGVFLQAVHTISHSLTHKRKQDLPILTSCIHWTPCVPIATRENPIVAPTMQWVPDIGSFKNDAINCQTAEPRKKPQAYGTNNNSNSNLIQKILCHIPTFFYEHCLHSTCTTEIS